MSALTRCLNEEAAAIAAAATRLEASQVDAALDLLERCADQRAKLVITGVGKSGIVARKIAATFSSIGLMALYLNPLDALHGDLGVVAPEDVVLLLSNSGETQELIEILPHLLADLGGTLIWQAPEQGQRGLPLRELCWNHTTLHARAHDPGWTYLQMLLPQPEAPFLSALKQRWGEDLLWHR